MTCAFKDISTFVAIIGGIIAFTLGAAALAISDTGTQAVEAAIQSTAANTGDRVVEPTVSFTYKVVAETPRVVHGALVNTGDAVNAAAFTPALHAAKGAFTNYRSNLKGNPLVTIPATVAALFFPLTLTTLWVWNNSLYTYRENRRQSKVIAKLRAQNSLL